MAKIEHDKYYTPKGVVLKVIELVSRDIMPIEQFTRIIEPSAGAGAFMRELPNTTIGYDILPEYEGIIKGDYLEQDIHYVKDSLVIGNPPFGTSGNLTKAFIKKSFEHSDYVAFVIAGENYKKESTIEGVELYKSYMLPEMSFSGVKLKCCFNIYIKGNKKIKEKKIKDVVIVEWSRQKNTTKKEETDYLNIKCDYRIVSYGSLRILNEYDNLKVCEFKIIFNNKKNFKPILESKLKSCMKRSVRASSNINKKEIIDLIYDTYPELRDN